jgi:hypothetical protein
VVKSTLISALQAWKQSRRGPRIKVKREKNNIKGQPITDIMVEEDGEKAAEDEIKSGFD